MKSKVNYFAIIIDIVAMAVLVFLDQLTKKLAVLNLMNKEPFSIIDGFFELRYLENKGAAFGMLQDKQFVFLIIGGVFVIAAVAFLIYIPAKRKYFGIRLSLVLIVAGAIGNIIDRVLYNYVVDFLYFIYINFPIFNVADCYVSVGTALLIILMLFYYKEEDLDFKKARMVKVHSSMIEKGDEEAK